MKKVFAVYKPKGVTSRGFLNKIIKISGIKKWGHGGTLDPLAEGVLVVGYNEGTKELFSEKLKEKQYLAVVKLGEKSTTDDEEGKKSIVSSKKADITEVKKVISKMVGEINQLPPLFSAIKIKGKEAYKLARKGEKPHLEKRKVVIKKIDILSYNYPFLKIRVVTGPGVYIRSLARDIGELLSTGGYLYSLVREKVGKFKIKDCINIKEIKMINICDENNNVTNKETTITEAHKNGFWHRSVHVWIYNSKGEVLLQKRSENNLLYPSMWDSASAGHVDLEEDPIDSAIREIKEEIGLSVNKEDLQFYTKKVASNTYNKIINNEFNYVYLLKSDIDINDLQIQKEEVEEVRFFSIEEVKNDIKKNKEKYVPHGDYWFAILDEIKNNAII